ncbi:hypothetical protein [Laspinema sp. D2d]|nr:hypothetical protein [Laspinema sp. D2d]
MDDRSRSSLSAAFLGERHAMAQPTQRLKRLMKYLLRSPQQ